MIQELVFLKPGHTPDNPGNVGVMGSGWGKTAKAAIRRYEKSTGDKVLEYWERGEQLYVITAWQSDNF